MVVTLAREPVRKLVPEEPALLIRKRIGWFWNNFKQKSSILEPKVEQVEIENICFTTTFFGGKLIIRTQDKNHIFANHFVRCLFFFISFLLVYPVFICKKTYVFRVTIFKY